MKRSSFISINNKSTFHLKPNLYKQLETIVPLPAIMFNIVGHSLYSL